MADVELPYIAEYAKSNRSSCKLCKNGISKDSLRMGIMIQSPHFDGRVPLWHHFDCFFNKKNLTTTGDIIHFDNLRYEDQQKIKSRIGGVSSVQVTNGKGKGKKKGKAAAPSSNDEMKLKEFSIEYAKSSKSSCRFCEEKIMKKELRISKLDRESEAALRYGPCPGWHHVDCFVEAREELGFMASGDKLPGFAVLEDDDKELVKSKIPALEQPEETKKQVSKEAPPAKKSKPSNDKEEEVLKAQSKLLFSFRDALKKKLKKKELQAFLEANGQEVPVGESNLLDLLADGLSFGALKPCPECGGQLRYGTNMYKCTGYLTGWTKCLYVTKKPDRKAFVVPDEFKEKVPKLSKYVYKPRDRLIPTSESPTSTPSGLAKKKIIKPLHGFKIAIIGDLHQDESEAKALIAKKGGRVLEKLEKGATCAIATKDAAEKEKKNIKKAQSLQICVISEEFLVDISKIEDNSIVPALMKKYMLFSWGKDPEEILPTSSGFKSSGSGSSGLKSMTLKVSAGGKAAVDPASGLDDTHQVVEKDGNVYNVVLNKVDVMRGRNSYYKLQLLKHNKKKQYVIFRAWGRVGTDIGDSKTQNFASFEAAVDDFERVYLEQTGNHWCNRDNFVKQPNLYYPLDIDYGTDQTKSMETLKPGAGSKLSMPIQELICLIFDVEAMKKAMLEFEIDLKKMPLGKLSKKQIQSAYAILGEVQKILNGDKNETKILDASNRFYTLIPHDFGLKKPPLLNNDVILQLKTEMLESLLEIECAYTMLQESGNANDDPIDKHYEQLHTEIETLDKDSNEFKRIEEYLKNTHAPTHTQYKLELEEVFKINRKGESERYQKFKSLHNKKLLWHGSRTTNYAGILSQGLRIAPPEAPVTGYMFGKGVYFADMATKSANYCYSNRSNPTGLLLLCEVALGNMYEKLDSEFVEKLPKGKHSTKGLGQTEPDPKATIVEDGIEIPLGKPVKTTKDRRTLLYNEYIVYDVNQINIKYLLKVRFNYEYIDVITL